MMPGLPAGVCCKGHCSVLGQTLSCKDTCKNYSETDVDCGGPDCLANCGMGGGCNGNADCLSGICMNNVCQ